MTFASQTSGAALPAAPARAGVWQPAQLADAFATFEAASETLADCYQRLESRVAELTDALSHSRAALESELQERERLATRLSALLEALPGGVIVLDGQGCLAQFNPAARDLLGPLALHEPWIRVVARAFAPQWDDGHDISLVDGRLVNVATAALVGEPGQILLIKDVSETRSLQEQLNHHRRLSAKTELAAVLAHQVRTPLATALLQLGMLNGANLVPEAQSRARHKALVAMRQLERLVNDMLSYARGGVIAAEPLALDGLVDELLHTCDAQTETAGNEFEFAVKRASDPIEIMGSRSALLSIMLNLVDNARLAQNGRGKLMLEVWCDATQVTLLFTDIGPGIKTAHRARIFEPFFTTRQAGTGLGLSVARAIARAHGGDLTLADAAESATIGAQFVLRLPRRRAAAGIAAHD